MKKWLLNTKRGLPISWLVVLFMILLFGNVIPRHGTLICLAVVLLLLFGGLSIAAVAISARGLHYGRMLVQLLLNGLMFVLCVLSLVSMLVFSFDCFHLTCKTPVLQYNLSRAFRSKPQPQEYTKIYGEVILV